VGGQRQLGGLARDLRGRALRRRPQRAHQRVRLRHLGPPAIRAIYFEVYKSGVTDFDNPDLWRQLDVQVLSRPVGSAATWRSQYVRFDGRAGNNARYGLLLREFDPLGENTITDRANCPAASLALSPDGQYVTTELDYYFRVNGVEYRPAAGGAFRGRFSQYRGLFEVCLSR
jgi:hypothetical protein